jgi:hypothetical protein
LAGAGACCCASGPVVAVGAVVTAGRSDGSATRTAAAEINTTAAVASQTAALRLRPLARTGRLTPMRRVRRSTSSFFEVEGRIMTRVVTSSADFASSMRTATTVALS